MVLSSIQVCMDSSDWSQSVMHERALKPFDDSILPACSRSMMEQTGLKPPPPPHPEQGLKCPRCDSSNTKFCYYNNYSLSQPRHFCKTCKRYWTRGGTLRNVPVGGGCRKNKRVKRTVDQSGPSSLQMSEAAAAASTSVGSASHGLNTNGSLIPNIFFSGLSNSGVPGDGFHNVAIQRALPNINGCEFLRTSFDFQNNLSALSSLNALSALNGLNSFRPNFNLNPSRIEHGTLVGDLSNTFFESFPQQISEAQPLALLNPSNSDGLSPYGLSLDGMNCNESNKRPEGTQWRSTEQQLKLAETSDADAGLVAFTDLENLNHSRHENLKAVTSLPASCVKVEDHENRLTTAPEWALTSPSEPNLFETGGDSAYWNGGTWTDLASYGSSASPLI